LVAETGKDYLFPWLRKGAGVWRGEIFYKIMLFLSLILNRSGENLTMVIPRKSDINGEN
jgi:hypothetical protein